MFSFSIEARSSSLLGILKWKTLCLRVYYIGFSVNVASFPGKEDRKPVSALYFLFKQLAGISIGIEVLYPAACCDGKGGEKDVERICSIRKAVGKDVRIRVDANQGWTREEAVRTICAMEDAGADIELVEQPVSYHDFKGMKYVTEKVATPILA